jgi:transcriptional regulator with XRE-family HTH domain
VIGARIRGWREKRGVPIAIFGQLCNLRSADISSIEQGTQEPTPGQIRVICDALRIDAVTLREGSIVVRKGGSDEPDNF